MNTNNQDAANLLNLLDGLQKNYGAGFRGHLEQALKSAAHWLREVGWGKFLLHIYRSGNDWLVDWGYHCVVDSSAEKRQCSAGPETRRRADSARELLADWERNLSRDQYMRMAALCCNAVSAMEKHLAIAQGRRRFEVMLSAHEHNWDPKFHIHCAPQN